MSIRDFHSQLVSGNNKNNLFGALRRLSQIADPKSLFQESPTVEWPSWTSSQNASLQTANGTV
jgi:hypothetical protein